jgi:hypothetical protein
VCYHGLLSTPRAPSPRLNRPQGKDGERWPLLYSLSRLVSLHGGGSASRGKALVLAMRVCGRFQFVAAGTQSSSTDSTNCVRVPWSSLSERRGEERGRRAGLWLANGAHVEVRPHLRAARGGWLTAWARVSSVGEGSGESDGVAISSVASAQVRVLGRTEKASGPTPVD